MLRTIGRLMMWNAAGRVLGGRHAKRLRRTERLMRNAARQRARRSR